MKIYVIRHGQTDYNVKNVFQGRKDIPLNDMGIKQAEETAEKFKDINLDYIDFENEYKHSKWLSFMERRLKIATNLLSDKGIIFISIDDNEQSELKLLCNDIFG